MMPVLRPTLSGLLAAALGAALSLVPNAAATTFTVAPSRSHAQISVGKSGALSFAAGHTHEVNAPVAGGTVDLDPTNPLRSRVRLEFRASAVTVIGNGEPPDDLPKVQEAMLSDKVLDAARHPTIAFQSTSIQIGSRPTGAASDRDGDSLDLFVVGELTIRGTTQPVRAPVHVEVSGDSLTARGRFSIKQTSFGIKPITVGGVVSVKDTLDISFTIVARR